ncbi:hypothetical protein BC332_34359 [Capsicum chinense]|nr:hypothetical protein BC332_34359 [Capsicum chinense]
MFSCKNDYATDELKVCATEETFNLEFYVVSSKFISVPFLLLPLIRNTVLHLYEFWPFCYAKYLDSGPRELSYYRCGLLGYAGLECTVSRGETSGTGSLNPCYICGEEGHFACECTNLSKINKRNHESSTPKKKVRKKRKEQKEFRSEPRDFGRA